MARGYQKGPGSGGLYGPGWGQQPGGYGGPAMPGGPTYGQMMMGPGSPGGQGAPGSGLGRVEYGGPGIGSTLWGWVQDNPELALGLAQGAVGLFSESPQEQYADVQEGHLGLARDRFKEEKRQASLEERRRAAAAARLEEARERARQRREEADAEWDARWSR